MMRLARLHFIAVMLPVILLVAGSTGCGQNRTPFANDSPINSNGSEIVNNMKEYKVKVRIGSRVFNATLLDTPTAAAFKAMLPLTLDMDELNGNEKKYDFSVSLPTAPSAPKTINNGELMIWGTNTLVLFYKTFPTQYSYTKLGRIDDPCGLEDAVGKGSVTVTFELDRSTEEKR